VTKWLYGIFLKLKFHYLFRIAFKSYKWNQGALWQYDDYNRESLDMLVDFSLPAQRVLRGLDQLIAWRGKPKRIRSDNGPEYISDLMAAWCKQQGIEHVFTQPGNPQQNAYVERFNRTVRYECLNQYLFRDLNEVQDYTTDWQYFYNHERPHMSVNGCPPNFKQ